MPSFRARLGAIGLAVVPEQLLAALPAEVRAKRNQLLRYLGELVSGEMVRAIVAADASGQSGVLALTNMRVLFVYENKSDRYGPPLLWERPTSKITGVTDNGPDLTLWLYNERKLVCSNLLPTSGGGRIAELVGPPPGDQFSLVVPPDRRALLTWFNRYVDRYEQLLSVAAADFGVNGLVALTARRLLWVWSTPDERWFWGAAERETLRGVRLDADGLKVFRDGKATLVFTDVMPETFLQELVTALGLIESSVADQRDTRQSPPIRAGSDSSPVAFSSTTDDPHASQSSERSVNDRERGRLLFLRGADAQAAGQIDAARELFAEAASSGWSGALVLLGALTSDEGDLDGAIRYYQQAAEAGEEGAALLAGMGLREAHDVPGAITWMTRAREAGDPGANRHLAGLYLASGDVHNLQRSLEAGAEEGDLVCAYDLVIFHGKANRGEEMEGALAQYAKLAVEQDVQNEPWAHIEDLSTLTDAELTEYDAQAARWKAPYAQIADTIQRDQGPSALPHPVGDPERTLEAMKILLKWAKLRQSEAERRQARARAALDEATQLASDASRRAPGSSLTIDTLASRAGSEWRGDAVELKGCRILSEVNSSHTTRHVTIEFAPNAPIVIKAGGKRRGLEWVDVDHVRIESLFDRSRISTPRVVGLGLLSLGAQKRTSWCALTIDCRQGHAVFEIPTEAHRLRAMFATAGIDTK